MVAMLLNIKTLFKNADSLVLADHFHTCIKILSCVCASLSGRTGLFCMLGLLNALREAN